MNSPTFDIGVFYYIIKWQGEQNLRRACGRWSEQAPDKPEGHVNKTKSRPTRDRLLDHVTLNQSVCPETPVGQVTEGGMSAAGLPPAMVYPLVVVGHVGLRLMNDVTKMLPTVPFGG